MRSDTYTGLFPSANLWQSPLTFFLMYGKFVDTKNPVKSILSEL